MFVEKLFKIPKSVIESVKKHPYKFGFDGFGELVYYTNYSRLLPNGTQETWIDTCIRVVEGVLSIRKSWYKIHSLKWDEQYWESIAGNLLYYIYTLKILPPGRGLWASGTAYVYERGSMALNNCAASLIESKTFAEDLGWVMDALMCGTGVGVRPIIDESFITKLGYHGADNNCWTIPDSREGWVQSVIMLINSYRVGNKCSFRFDYDQIRGKGEKITGFGGTASGPEPLIILHNRIRTYIEAYINSCVNYDYMRLSANIVNAIGACIIAGNVRRSAELILGSPYDETFKSLSDYNLFPERAEIGWMSNNSYALETKNDFTRIDDIANSICEKGEGGLVNFKNIRKYSRFGDASTPDNANCANPCAEIPIYNKGLCLTGDTCVLTPYGVRRIDKLYEDFVYSTDGKMQRFSEVVKKGVKSVFKVSFSGMGVIKATDSHLVETTRGMVAVKDLRIGKDKVRANTGYSLTKYGDYDLKYEMLGWLHGDGWYSSHGLGISFNYNDGDNDALEAFLPLFREMFDAKAVKPMKNDNVSYQLGLAITPHRQRICEEYGLVSGQAHEKELPLSFHEWELIQQLSFIRGLFSADSGICGKANSMVRYASSSCKLLEQVQQFLSTIGIRSKFYSFESKDMRRRTQYFIIISKYSARVFFDVIGFVTKVKQDKFNSSTYNLYKDKELITVSSVEAVGQLEVFDIVEVANTNTFYANGFPVHNCNLFEVYPAKARSKKEFLEMCRLAAIYTTSVSLLPTHSEVTNQVIVRKRRIGVSLSGVADWFDSWGGHIVKFMRSGYNETREFANYLNAEAGVVAPIRITTVKPSGSVSQLSGVSPGMHFPVHGPYAIRRMRISNTSQAVELCRQAGLLIEPDVNNRETTQVIEYPIYTGTTRSSHEVSAWEQFSLLALLQREWSDNMVSCTIHFTEEEKKDIPRMLAYFLPTIKSVSLLLKNDEMYPQMPYEKISEAEHRRRTERMKKIDWAQFGNSDGKEAKFCSNDSCEI